MEYNTSRNRLIIPEYGRNIQRMIEYAIALPDREERNRAARSIVAVMGYLNPQLQTVTDFKHKLWDHLFIISDFRLDVDSPYPIPPKETLKLKPQRVPYPSGNIKYKYYGRNMEAMIKKIAELEENPKKGMIAHTLANFMKMSYLTWNKDTVDDSTILGHLEDISKGNLKLSSTARLNHTSELLAFNKEKERDQRDRDRDRRHHRPDKNKMHRKKRRK